MATRDAARRLLRIAVAFLCLVQLHGAEVEEAGTAAEDLWAAQCELAELVERLDPATELPTVVFVGHHNDGKSALLEAFTGVRLAHVGSVTTTRRPLQIHLQHDPSQESPAVFLARGGADEQPATAAEVRAYVEAESERLSQRGELDEEHIRVRVRWRHAMNVVLIDTPGLLSIPEKSGAADAELQRRSEAVEQLVLRQITSPARLILCLEDTSDWQLARTQPIVQRVDPQLARTVLVATKLDSKMAQFGMPEDLHRLLNPKQLLTAQPRLLAGPIFTSVPPVHDGAAVDEGGGQFASMVERHEDGLRRTLAERLGSSGALRTLLALRALHSLRMLSHIRYVRPSPLTVQPLSHTAPSHRAPPHHPSQRTRIVSAWRRSERRWCLPSAACGTSCRRRRPRASTCGCCSSSDSSCSLRRARRRRWRTLATDVTAVGFNSLATWGVRCLPDGPLMRTLSRPVPSDCAAVSAMLKGSIAVAASVHGETLEQARRV